VHFDASVASECIRALLVGQKENQIRLSLCTHDFFDHELNQGWRLTAMPDAYQTGARVLHDHVISVS
jgi:hypothetical protein